MIGLVAKDFRENDTGLEHIGTGRQQMGDGGVILQVWDAEANTVPVSDGGWRCLLIHEVPVDKSCAGESEPVAGERACGFVKRDEPQGLSSSGFEDSDLAQARVHAENAARPKGGYDRISWESAARLIWKPTTRVCAGGMSGERWRHSAGSYAFRPLKGFIGPEH